jgi:hypothetical protein
MKSTVVVLFIEVFKLRELRERRSTAWNINLKAERPGNAHENQTGPADHCESDRNEISEPGYAGTHGSYLEATLTSTTDALRGDCVLAIACRRRTTSAYRTLSVFFVSKGRFLFDRRSLTLTPVWLLKFYGKRDDSFLRVLVQRQRGIKLDVPEKR